MEQSTQACMMAQDPRYQALCDQLRLAQAEWSKIAQKNARFRGISGIIDEILDESDQVWKGVNAAIGEFCVSSMGIVSNPKLLDESQS
jgi:hypothetical protein